MQSFCKCPQYLTTLRSSENSFACAELRRGIHESPQKMSESLWEVFFRDPTEFNAVRNMKKGHKLPDFRHRWTGKFLWIHSPNNPPWVHAKLQELKSGFLEVNIKDGRAGLIELIKSCGKENDISTLRSIYADQGCRVAQDLVIANTLIRSFARCGAMKEAWKVFDKMEEPDAVSWTALIAGYAERGFGEEALMCFMEMQSNRVTPNSITYICALKACTIVRAIEIVRKIHDQVRKQELLNKDIVLGNTFINAYAKCGAVKEAREMFEQLVEPDVVSWNALIAGYAEQGFGEQALACFMEMQSNRIVPDSVTYVCVLKACATVGAVEVVDTIHTQVRQKELLNKFIVLGNTLVNTYARCGAMKEAREVFEQIAEPDVVSWTALIAGYAEQGFGKEALSCFREMKSYRVTPNSVTYKCALKACAIVGSLEIVEEIHVQVKKRALLNKDIPLGNALITAYARCGAVKEAQEVFEQLTEPSIVSWTTLIAAYSEQGYGHEALVCFREMKRKRVMPDSVAYTCALKACAIVGALTIVKEIYAQVKQQALLNKDILLGNTLVNAYARCGAMEEAREVFHQLEEPDVVSWNALIAGYVAEGFGEDALVYFTEMQSNKMTPNSVTYTCALKACAIVGAINTVKEIHAEVRNRSLLNDDIMLGNTLVNAYARCGAVTEAWAAFSQLAEPDIISWNALISGYVEQGYGKDALVCFRKMQSDKVAPDLVTFTCALKACALLGAIETVEEVHAQMREHELLYKDIVLGNALVYAYARCGEVKEAREIFDQLADLNTVSWNTLIAGYAERSFGEEALSCFREMQIYGVTSNAVTCTCTLKACAIVGAVDIVDEMHDWVRHHALLNKDIVLGNTLVNAYARCGAVKEAWQVFQQLAEPDVVSWNAVIAGYAKMGWVNEMLELFNRMMSTGIFPCPVTFIVLLHGCSHGALLEEGIRLFTMIGIRGLPQTAEHYSCMVDLFGRAGRFDKAKCFVLDDLSTLLSFLGACCKWVEVDHGRWAFEKILQLDRKCTSAYVCMSNLFAAAGMVKEADEIELLRVEEDA